MSLAPMKFGIVKGRYLAAVGDSATDPDLEPDGIPMEGEIEFIPQASAVLLATGVPDPVTVLPDRIVCGLDSEGYLVYPVGGTDRTVTLVSTDEPITNPVDWTYEVKYRLSRNGRSVSYASHNIKVPAGVVTDLTLSARVPSSSGTGVTRGIGVIDAQSENGALILTLTDGSQTDPVPLPEGPVGPPPELSMGVVTTGLPYPGLKGDKGDKGDPGGWTHGTGLSTTNLNAVLSPGLYFQDSSTHAANVTLNYPLMHSSVARGVLKVSKWATASWAIVQEYEPIGSSSIGEPVFYRRVCTADGVWSAWRPYTSQRVDETAGRAIYAWDEKNGREQLIYGDTGNRTLDVNSALVVSGTGATWCYVRRVGQLVTVVFRLGVAAANSSGANLLAAQLPLGFRAAAINAQGCAILESGSGVNTPVPVQLTTSGELRLWHTSTSGTLSAALAVPTNDAWPTSLPGTPSGGIPNL